MAETARSKEGTGTLNDDIRTHREASLKSPVAIGILSLLEQYSCLIVLPSKQLPFRLKTEAAIRCVHVNALEISAGNQMR